ncbi:hypothetical protein SCALM49S_08824 [Streptomyces californicus]
MIWIRLPQVSSRTARVTGPASIGSWVNRTPRPLSRSNSARTSSTAKAVARMPSATRAVVYGFTAGCLSGSREFGAVGDLGDTTVSERSSPPSGTSCSSAPQDVRVEAHGRLLVSTKTLVRVILIAALRYVGGVGLERQGPRFLDLARLPARAASAVLACRCRLRRRGVAAGSGAVGLSDGSVMTGRRAGPG